MNKYLVLSLAFLGFIMVMAGIYLASNLSILGMIVGGVGMVLVNLAIYFTFRKGEFRRV